MRAEDVSKFIFILTYGRSGSTLLQRVLQTLPGACIKGENNNVLYSLFQSWNRVRGAKILGKDLWRRNDPWYGIDTVDPELYAQQIVQLFIDTILQPPEGSRILGFKEIRYHETGKDLPDFLAFLRDKFPNPAFIVLTRDLDQVARSSWWAKMDPAKVKEMLADAEKTFHEFVSQNPTTAYHLDYSDVVGQTEKFGKLFDFLKVKGDKAVIDAVLAVKR